MLPRDLTAVVSSGLRIHVSACRSPRRFSSSRPKMTISRCWPRVSPQICTHNKCICAMCITSRTMRGNGNFRQLGHVFIAIANACEHRRSSILAHVLASHVNAYKIRIFYILLDYSCAVHSTAVHIRNFSYYATW